MKIKNVFPLLIVAVFLTVIVSCKEDDEVNNKVAVAVTDVTLDISLHSLTAGSDFILTATVLPADADNKELLWASDNFEVASVFNGKVIARGAGEATITVTTVDGGKTATCTVTVPTVPVESVIVSTSLVFTIGDIPDQFVTREGLLPYSIEPATASNKKVTWSSDNHDVAIVDQHGYVHAISEGTANITVTAVDGGKTAICEVYVKEIKNLLKNAGFEEQTVINDLGETHNTEFRQEINGIADGTWMEVSADWFISYYADDPNGTGTAALRPNRNGTGVDPNFFLTGNGAFFGAHIINTWAGRLGGNATAGLYQLVSVVPGETYEIMGIIGRRATNAQSTIKPYETAKILSPDGTQTYDELLIDTERFMGTFNGQPTSIVKLEGTVTIPAGINKIRFQIDQRTYASPNQAPLTLIDDLYFGLPMPK